MVVRATGLNIGANRLSVSTDPPPLPFVGPVDKFDSLSIASHWTTSGVNSQIVPGSSKHLLSTSYNADRHTLYSYTFDEAQAIIEVPLAESETTAATREVYWIWHNSGDTIKLQVALSVSTLYISVTGKTDTTITYDSTAHRWWRIRETGGTLYFDTAPDGTTWTNQATYAHTLTLTSLRETIGAGLISSDANPGYAYFDNLNNPPATPSTSPMYWGAWVGAQFTGTEAPFDMAAATAHETNVGKAMSLVHWSSNFTVAFQTTQFTAVRTHGSIPFFSWANNTAAGATYSNANVVAGVHDTYITTWANAAKTWGHPFFLRFAWEMNGSWFSWGTSPGNSAQAAEYVAMWQHVYDIFQTVGATNATWVWCPNVETTATLTTLSTLYPGDSYVDWTGLDGYNGNVPWLPLSGVYGKSYRDIIAIAPTKPMFIGEYASTETGGSKATWITDGFYTMATEFPMIRAAMWFEKTEAGPGGFTDWPIESSSPATTAYAAGIANTRFKANNYSALDGLVRVIPAT